MCEVMEAQSKEANDEESMVAKEASDCDDDDDAPSQVCESCVLNISVQRVEQFLCL